MPTEQKHTFYNYARDPPTTRGPHHRYIKEESGPHRIREIPERCPCQDDPRLGTRQPLRDAEHESRFWRNLHVLRGFFGGGGNGGGDAVRAFEIDDAVRREEESGMNKETEKEKKKEEGEGVLEGGCGQEGGT